MMAVVTSGAVTVLRYALDRRGVLHKHLKDDVLARVLRKVGDIGLAADAMTMRDRPEWLTKMVGERRCPWPDCEGE